MPPYLYGQHHHRHQVNVLSEDMCSLSRNSKESLDVLGDLESRLKKLRVTNMHLSLIHI